MTGLTKEEKKNQRQGKFLNVIATILFFTIGCAGTVGCTLLIIQIPFPKNPFLVALASIGILILVLGSMLASFSVGVLITSPIFSKSDKKWATYNKRNGLPEACVYLREYYGWQEPCMVTKCYESSNRRFNNHDVCIFVADGELRITANLKHGFSKRENDLGCYAFELDEISLDQIQEEHFLITELKSGNTFFRLGRRAKGFIEKNFISKCDDT